MKILEYPQIGDIGCTRSNKFLGKTIRWMQSKQGEGEAEVNHTFWTIENNSGKIIEALNKVEVNNVLDYLGEYQDVYIIRIKRSFLKHGKLIKAVKHCIKKYDDSWHVYGYGKIFLQSLDTLFCTNKFTESSFTNFPYCSELVAKDLMRKCGFLFFNKKLNIFLDPKSVTPANILNDGFDRNNVFEVYKYLLVSNDTVEWKLEKIS
jgi:hypothetical protein